jgi:hypothetical protein
MNVLPTLKFQINNLEYIPPEHTNITINQLNFNYFNHLKILKLILRYFKLIVISPYNKIAVTLCI